MKMESDEFEEERVMTCGRCKKSVPISTIQYLPKGDGNLIALCSNCRSEKTTKPKPIEKLNAAPEKEKTNYSCERCNYKFSHDPTGDAALKCPYCGQSDKLKQLSASPPNRFAQQI